MTLTAGYHDARRDEDVARLRRVVALRAMLADGMSQRQVAEELGISQPAVSQQLKAAPDLAATHPVTLIEAAAPILRRVADERGFERLAVFGSVARGDAREDSDIDFLVDPPTGTTIIEIVRMRELLERILGHPVDLVTYGGLSDELDDDIQRDAVLL